MPYPIRTNLVRGTRLPWAMVLHLALATALLAAVPFTWPGAAVAHEGHDHDKPAPLNLPIAPRVIAVTPDYELVGVLSGSHRLTIFLHRFETGEPVKSAKLSVSAGEQEVEAQAKEDGVFEVSAPWISAASPLDIVFRLTLPDDQDILTGRLEKAATVAGAPAGEPPANASQLQQAFYVGASALMAGVLLTLLISARLSRWRQARSGKAPDAHPETEPEADPNSKVKQLRRAPLAGLAVLLTAGLAAYSATAQTATNLPSVPATMATDMPQRMAD